MNLKECLFKTIKSSGDYQKMLDKELHQINLAKKSGNKIIKNASKTL